MTWLSDAAVNHLRDVATRPEAPSDRYVLHEPIGRGGMGTVYAATDVLLERSVAFKVSNAPMPDGDLETRLRNEARVLASLEHPGIVPVHDAGVLGDGRLFYVMKRVQGETLAAAPRDLATEVRALAVFERIVEAVAFAHARGVVHRDLKPSNVMIGSFGEVLVLDWGVAKILGAPGAAAASADGRGSAGGGTNDPASADPATPARATSPGRLETRAGTRIGTPGFMSPEQASGEVTVGPATDVYSLGALLFWMLTGDAPPDGSDAVSRRLQALNPRPPKRLGAIVQKCLAQDAGDRYADAGALGADLTRYRAGEAVTAHRESLPDRLGRWFQSYRGAILLVAAYLVMRALFATFAR